MNRQSGHTLVELMISLTLAMLISIAALYIFSGQVRTFFQHARKQQTTNEVQAAFEAVTTLLRQAEMCLSLPCSPVEQVAISYPAGVANPNGANTPYIAGDMIDLDFTVPGSYAIWPNISGAYTDNAMHLSWSQADGKLNLGNGADSAAATAMAHSAGAFTIAGSSGKLNTRIINFDVWPLTSGGAGTSAIDKPTAGYHVVMTARVGSLDMSYTNPLDPNGPMQHYRTVSYEADILPRNW
jgi:type II secretory pathway pseudopilin PulG